MCRRPFKLREDIHGAAPPPVAPPDEEEEAWPELNEALIN